MSSPVSYSVPIIVGARGPPVEIRMVGRRWISPYPVSNEWSAWCKPNIRRPVAMSRSSSVEVGPPSAGHASKNVSVDWENRF